MGLMLIMGRNKVLSAKCRFVRCIGGFVNDFLDRIIIYLIISAFSGLPLMFVIRVCYKYFVGMFQKKKKLQYAKDLGHVVEAHCVKRREPTGIAEPTDKYYATYSFEFKGKEYKRRFTFSSSPPTQMILYFYKKPSKAEPENSFIGVETGLLPFYVFGFIGVFILLMIFGVQ